MHTLFLYRTGPPNAANTKYHIFIDTNRGANESSLERVGVYRDISVANTNAINDLVTTHAGSPENLLARIDKLIEP